MWRLNSNECEIEFSAMKWLIYFCWLKVRNQSETPIKMRSTMDKINDRMFFVSTRPLISVEKTWKSTINAGNIPLSWSHHFQHCPVACLPFEHKKECLLIMYLTNDTCRDILLPMLVHLPDIKLVPAEMGGVILHLQNYVLNKYQTLTH